MRRRFMSGIGKPKATWIFLRGLIRESRHWGDFVDCFQQAVPNTRVVALDLPGNGALNHLASPIDVADMVWHCRRETARLGLAPPYHVLAMSLGAMVAVAWAHAHPGDISRCVLVNTSLRPFSPFYRRLRPRTYSRLLRLVLFKATDRAWEEHILRLTSRLRTGAADLLEKWIALRMEHPVTRRNALRQLYAAARYCPPLVPPRVKLLLLASERDELVHAACSRALADAWRCELMLHPYAGHDLPLDDGLWVAMSIRQWLEEPDGSSPEVKLR